MDNNSSQNIREAGDVAKQICERVSFGDTESAFPRVMVMMMPGKESVIVYIQECNTGRMVTVAFEDAVQAKSALQLLQAFLGPKPGTMTSSNGAKHLDDGKPDMSLLPYEGLAGAALAFQDGIRPGKYQRNDWRKGMDHSRMIAAIMRHASRRAGGELIDPDSGLPHEYMIAARSLMLATFTMTGTGNDDLTEKK